MDPFLDGEERAVYSPRRTTVVGTYLFKGTIFLLVNAEEPIQGQPMTRHTVWQDEHQFGSGRISSSWLYSTVVEYVTRHGLRYEALRLSATCLSVQNWATFMESDVGLTVMVLLISWHNDITVIVTFLFVREWTFFALKVQTVVNLRRAHM